MSRKLITEPECAEKRRLSDQLLDAAFQIAEIHAQRTEKILNGVDEPPRSVLRVDAAHQRWDAARAAFVGHRQTHGC